MNQYIENVSESILMGYQQLEESELSIDTFSFYTSVSAVFSSKIEGESIELDSYVKYKRFASNFYLTIPVRLMIYTMLTSLRRQVFVTREILKRHIKFLLPAFCSKTNE